MNWMNLPSEYSTKESKFVILPIEYENNPTYGKGASNGSKEIIEASKHLEYYDEQFDNEPFLEGIELLNSVKSSDPEEMVEQVSNIISKQRDRFIIGLGGDHAVTLGMVKGIDQLHQDFSIIILDAHADFRDSWNDSQYNHACVSKQLSKKHNLALIGVRAMDIDEKKQIDESKNLHLITIHNFSLEKIKQMLPKLNTKVYLSIDVDVFDPSFIKNTGTPEPGGVNWKEMMGILGLIFDEKEVIGADLVEFAPVENYRSEAYSLAKLAYKLMALAIRVKQNL